MKTSTLTGIAWSLTLASLVITGVITHDHIKLTQVRDKQVWQEKAIQTLEKAATGDPEAIANLKEQEFVRLKTEHHNDLDN